MAHKTGDGWATRRWRDGERLYAENDFVTMVYVATEDSSKHGLGLHGEDQMCVIYHCGTDGRRRARSILGKTPL